MATFSINENFGTYQGQTSYILDGNASNCWQADAQQGSGKYVLLTASERIHVNTVTYTTTKSSEVFKAGAYLQVSEDGQTFIDVGQFSGSASQTFTVNADCRYLRIYCKSGNNYASISELAIDYSEISTVTHSVAVQAGDGVTVDKPGENTVPEGQPFTLTINGSVRSITDNGTDVMGQLEAHQPQSGGEVTKYPAAYSTSGTAISGTRYRNCIGKGSSAAATGNDYANGNSGATSVINYTFDFSDIPENAVIESVSVKVGGHAENTSRSTATLQLYAGNTAKGSQSKFTSTSKQVITMTPGTWTRAELQNATLRFTIGYYGGLVNGVDWTVVYSVPGGGGVYYTYTIGAVAGDHVIAINAGATAATRQRVKVGGSYRRVLRIHQKDAGHYTLTDEGALQTGEKFKWKGVST